jgi:hypothetical protein
MDTYLPYLSPAVGLISLFIATYLSIRFNWWGTKKELTYRLLADGPVFSPDDEIRDRVEIFYDKKPVEAVSFLIIQFTNSGRTNISKNDFDGDLKFNFQGTVKILSADVIERNPSELPVEFEPILSTVLIRPLLLNRGDSFKIKILVDTLKPVLTVEARIVGVKSVKRVSERAVTLWSWFVGFLLFYGTIATLTVWILDKASPWPSSLPKIGYLSIVIGLTTLIGAFAAGVFPYQFKRRW